MRNTRTIVITEDNRDKGKIFVICEMPASQAEEWAMRALEAISQNTDIPAGLSNAGMLGVFILGLKPILAAPWSMVKPLLAEMFDSCLSIQPDKNNPNLLRGAGTPMIKPMGGLVEVDIEEVSTRALLRDKIIELHTGFSLAAVLSQGWNQVVTVAASLNIQTSQDTSDSPSPVTLN